MENGEKAKGTVATHCCLQEANANTTPLTTAVPNFVELVMQIQAASYSWRAKLDVKDAICDSTLGTPQGSIHAHSEGSAVYL